MAGIDVVTFDCYGTLIDWDGGAASFLYGMALRHAAASGAGEESADGMPSASSLRERWERIQFAMIAGSYRPYREILGESLSVLAAQEGWAVTEADRDAFVRSMRSWQPFPETRPALRAARAAGVRLVIISNTDRDIIAHTLAHLEVPFDAVITAEDCGAYKPDPSVFTHALDAAGAPPDRILHVAFGFEYDIRPAKTLGMRTAWVNRAARQRPPGSDPDVEWRDLWALPGALAS